MAKKWTENLPNKGEFPRKRGQWQELDERLVYENPWIQVHESNVINPNGGKGIYGVVDFKNLAIGIIPLDDEMNTWIVGQERFPFYGKYTWEIIEGGGPLHQDPLISAQNELSEEAGLAAQKWDKIQEMDLSNSATTERAIIYIARELSAKYRPQDDTELLELQKIPFEDLYQRVMRGEIVDSLSVAGVLKVKLLLNEGTL